MRCGMAVEKKCKRDENIFAGSSLPSERAKAVTQKADHASADRKAKAFLKQSLIGLIEYLRESLL